MNQHGQYSSEKDGIQISGVQRASLPNTGRKEPRRAPPGTEVNRSLDLKHPTDTTKRDETPIFRVNQEECYPFLQSQQGTRGEEMNEVERLQRFSQRMRGAHPVTNHRDNSKEGDPIIESKKTSDRKPYVTHRALPPKRICHGERVNNTSGTGKHSEETEGELVQLLTQDWDKEQSNKQEKPKVKQPVAPAVPKSLKHWVHQSGRSKLGQSQTSRSGENFKQQEINQQRVNHLEQEAALFEQTFQTCYEIPLDESSLKRAINRPRWRRGADVHSNNFSYMPWSISHAKHAFMYGKDGWLEGDDKTKQEQVYTNGAPSALQELQPGSTGMGMMLQNLGLRGRSRDVISGTFVENCNPEDVPGLTEGNTFHDVFNAHIPSNQVVEYDEENETTEDELSGRRGKLSHSLSRTQNQDVDAGPHSKREALGQAAELYLARMQAEYGTFSSKALYHEIKLSTAIYGKGVGIPQSREFFVALGLSTICQLRESFGRAEGLVSYLLTFVTDAIFYQDNPFASRAQTVAAADTGIAGNAASWKWMKLPNVSDDLTWLKRFREATTYLLRSKDLQYDIHKLRRQRTVLIRANLKLENDIQRRQAVFGGLMENWKRGLLAICLFCWKAMVFTKRFQRPQADRIFHKWWTGDMNKKWQRFQQWCNISQQLRCRRYEEQFDHLKRQIAKLENEISVYSSKLGSAREEVFSLYQTVGELEGRHSKFQLRRDIIENVFESNSLKSTATNAASWAYAARGLCRTLLRDMVAISGLKALKTFPEGRKASNSMWFDDDDSDFLANGINPPIANFHLVDLCEGGVDCTLLACSREEVEESPSSTLLKYYKRHLDKEKDSDQGKQYRELSPPSPSWPGSLLYSLTDFHFRQSVREVVSSDIRERAKLYKSASGFQKDANFTPIDRNQFLSQIKEVVSNVEAPKEYSEYADVSKGSISHLLGYGEYGRYGKAFHKDACLASGQEARKSIIVDDLKSGFERGYFEQAMQRLFFWGYVHNAPLIQGIAEDHSASGTTSSTSMKLPALSGTLDIFSGSSKAMFSGWFALLFASCYNLFRPQSQSLADLIKLLCEEVSSLLHGQCSHDKEYVLSEAFHSLVVVAEHERRTRLGLPTVRWAESSSKDPHHMKQQCSLVCRKISKSIVGSISNIQNTVGKELNNAIGDIDKNSPRRSLTTSDALDLTLPLPSIPESHAEETLSSALRDQLTVIMWPAMALRQSVECYEERIGSRDRRTVASNTAAAKEGYEKRLKGLSRPSAPASAYFALREYGHVMIPRSSRTGLAERAVVQQLLFACQMAFDLEIEENYMDRFYQFQLPKDEQTLRARGIHFSSKISKCSRAVRKQCFYGFSSAKALNSAIRLAPALGSGGWVIPSIVDRWLREESYGEESRASLMSPIPSKFLRAQAIKVENDSNPEVLRSGLGQWFMNLLYLSSECLQQSNADVRASSNTYHRHLDYISTDIWAEHFKHLEKQETKFETSSRLKEQTKDMEKQSESDALDETSLMPEARRISDLLSIWALCTYCQENSDNLELGYEGHGDEYMLSALHASSVLEKTAIREELKDEYKRICSVIESFAPMLFAVFRAYSESSGLMDSHSLLKVLKDAKLVTFSPSAFGKDSNKMSSDEVVCPKHNEQSSLSNLEKCSLEPSIGMDEGRLYLTPAEFCEALLRIASCVFMNLSPQEIRQKYNEIYQIDDRVVGRKQMLKRKLYIPRMEIEIGGLSENLVQLMEKNVQQYVSASNPHPFRQMLQTAPFQVVFARFSERLNAAFKNYCIWQKKALQYAQECVSLNKENERAESNEENEELDTGEYPQVPTDDFDVATAETAAAVDEEQTADNSALEKSLTERKDYGKEWALETWMKFCRDANLLNDCMSALDTMDIFNLVGQRADEGNDELSNDSSDSEDEDDISIGGSFQQVSEEEDDEEEKSMSYTGFQEALATAASYIYRDPNVTIAQKLERLLEIYAESISEAAENILKHRSKIKEDPFFLLLE